MSAYSPKRNSENGGIPKGMDVRPMTKTWQNALDFREAYRKAGILDEWLAYDSNDDDMDKK